jgi:hypothetical protein
MPAEANGADAGAGPTRQGVIERWEPIIVGQLTSIDAPCQLCYSDSQRRTNGLGLPHV